MLRPPPRSPLTDPLFPYPTLFRSASSTLTNTAIFNPPNLAPSYGAGATLWIAACWAQFAGRPITTYPDDTINQNARNDGSADSRCEVACATRELNASSWEIGRASCRARVCQYV